MKILTFIIAIQFLIILAASYLLYTRPVQIVETPAKVTKYDIVLECQRLSVQADDDWGYGSCVSQLEEALKEGILGGSETI